LSSDSGNTALIWASKVSYINSREKVVQMLLNNPKVDPNLQNKYGYTALMFASKFSDTTSSENTVRFYLCKSIKFI
jgi:ankyrin repeat protein